MKRYLLDSYALLAYAENEPGARRVARIFSEASEARAYLYISVVNWGELYYIAAREKGEKIADSYLAMFRNFSPELVEVNEELALIAASFKASHRLSYADAIAAATSKKKAAVLVTGDPEFRALAKSISIEWLKE
jgi:uncharacterized protein